MSGITAAIGAACITVNSGAASHSSRRDSPIATPIVTPAEAEITLIGHYTLTAADFIL